MYRITTFSKIEDSKKNDYINLIKEIFYISSSVQTFNSEDHRNSFFNKWCGDYILNYPDSFFLMINNNDDSLFGYLSGCLDSTVATEVMKVPGQLIFADQFSEFPAHLHINFHPMSRGLGLGSKLIDHYCLVLFRFQIAGVHLVTSPGERNVKFYENLGFKSQLTRELNGSKLLFMGKKLK